MVEVASLKLIARAVLTGEDAEAVRLLRNDCRLYMTRTTDRISPAQQAAWFGLLDRSTNKLYLYDAVGGEDGVGWTAENVGYGLVRLIGGKWWVSGGLAPAWQGKGLGKQLFSHMLGIVGGECWLEVLEHNTRAVNTYRKLGFSETDRQSGTITMVRR